MYCRDLLHHPLCDLAQEARIVQQDLLRRPRLHSIVQSLVAQVEGIAELLRQGDPP